MASRNFALSYYFTMITHESPTIKSENRIEKYASVCYNTAVEIIAQQSRKKSQYPAVVKTAAVVLTAAAALAGSSCQVQQQQKPEPAEEGLLPGWIISK